MKWRQFGILIKGWNKNYMALCNLLFYRYTYNKYANICIYYSKCFFFLFAFLLDHCGNHVFVDHKWTFQSCEHVSVFCKYKGKVFRQCYLHLVYLCVCLFDSNLRLKLLLQLWHSTAHYLDIKSSKISILICRFFF